MVSFDELTHNKPPTAEVCWRHQLKGSIVRAEQLADHFVIDVDRAQEVISRYPMRINSYYLSLIKKIGDPFWMQAVPDIRELIIDTNQDDPLFEEAQSPHKTITHRYPDRVIFLVSNTCAMYCRHCMRKRKVGDRALNFQIHSSDIEDGLRYIRKNIKIREVILSGGDPLLLENNELDYILDRVSGISHVEIIRIHSRVPCTLPARITKNLLRVLKKYKPLYINTHFNHPDEITPEASKACNTLADAGLPLGCQTVLLKGVNDTPEIILELMKRLLTIRVKPYYLHHPDPVSGAGHFRPPLKTGLQIMRALRGHLSGMCVPQYMIDLPGGKGKLPLLPDYIKHVSTDKISVENYCGNNAEYCF